MARLTYIDEKTIEKFLDMEGGYVMEFNDNTFREFIYKSTGLDINDEKYHNASNSKAKRLKQFIKLESNNTFGKLLLALCNHWRTKFPKGQFTTNNDDLYKDCLKIVEKLKNEDIVETIDVQYSLTLKIGILKFYLI